MAAIRFSHYWVQTPLQKVKDYIWKSIKLFSMSWWGWVAWVVVVVVWVWGRPEDHWHSPAASHWPLIWCSASEFRTYCNMWSVVLTILPPPTTSHPPPPPQPGQRERSEQSFSYLDRRVLAAQAPLEWKISTTGVGESYLRDTQTIFFPLLWHLTLTGHITCIVIRVSAFTDIDLHLNSDIL